MKAIHSSSGQEVIDGIWWNVVAVWGPNDKGELEMETFKESTGIPAKQGMGSLVDFLKDAFEYLETEGVEQLHITRCDNGDN